MGALLAIDLGTSSVKVVIIDYSSKVLGVGSQEYNILSPFPGWVEQKPQTWWQATTLAVNQAKRGLSYPIRAIGLSGQMHGTVLLDKTLSADGPAIIWADRRSVIETEDFGRILGNDFFANNLGTAPAPGFMGPTLLWLLKNDPQRLDRARVCLLPKDYIRLRLTGDPATDPSDASSTALCNVYQRVWSTEVLDALGLPKHLLPPILDSTAVAGSLLNSAASDLDLPQGIPVITGCSDQVAQAVGNRLIDPGPASITIGSGGQIFVPVDHPIADTQLRLHLYCHAPHDRWYLLGAMLTAGLALRWFRDLLGLNGDNNAYAKLDEQAQGISPGSEGLTFLPYLNGERSPLMNPKAKGSFSGLTLNHNHGHLARAIMEGVAFAIRHVFETIRPLSGPINYLTASGKGLSSPIWRQIMADVLQQSLQTPYPGEQTAVGAALMAGIGIGVYSNYKELMSIGERAQVISQPNPNLAQLYNDKYQVFRDLYRRLEITYS